MIAGRGDAEENRLNAPSSPEKSNWQTKAGDPPHTTPDKPQRAGPLQVAQAVFWSFLGIRKQAAHEHDAVTITPVQAIVAGVIGAVIFVLSLILLVRYITS